MVETAFCIVTDYLVQNWSNDVSRCIPQYFSSMSEVKLYMSDSNGRLPQMRYIRGCENVPEREPRWPDL